MKESAYKYHFAESVNMPEVAKTLLLAVSAVEALHGRSKINLDADFGLDLNDRMCTICSGTKVGRDIASIFVGLASLEFGEESFTVDRVVVEARLSDRCSRVFGA